MKGGGVEPHCVLDYKTRVQLECPWVWTSCLNSLLVSSRRKRRQAHVPHALVLYIYTIMRVGIVESFNV